MSERTLWLDIEPQNRETAATMKFIVESCQKIHAWIAGKEGDPETLLKTYNEIGMNRSLLAIVPKEALIRAIELGLEAKPLVHFSVAPRKNWTKVTYRKKRMTWDEYLAGRVSLSAPQGNRTMYPELAVRELYEEGIIRFHWGTVKLLRWYHLKLGRFLAVVSIRPEELLREITGLDFRYREKSQQWQMRIRVKSNA